MAWSSPQTPIISKDCIILLREVGAQDWQITRLTDDLAELNAHGLRKPYSHSGYHRDRPPSPLQLGFAPNSSNSLATHYTIHEHSHRPEVRAVTLLNFLENLAYQRSKPTEVPESSLAMTRVLFPDLDVGRLVPRTQAPLPYLESRIPAFAKIFEETILFLQFRRSDARGKIPAELKLSATEQRKQELSNQKSDLRDGERLLLLELFPYVQGYLKHQSLLGLTEHHPVFAQQLKLLREELDLLSSNPGYQAQQISLTFTYLLGPQDEPAKTRLIARSLATRLATERFPLTEPIKNFATSEAGIQSIYVDARLVLWPESLSILGYLLESQQLDAASILVHKANMPETFWTSAQAEYLRAPIAQHALKRLEALAKTEFEMPFASREEIALDPSHVHQREASVHANTLLKVTPQGQQRARFVELGQELFKKYGNTLIYQHLTMGLDFLE